MRDYALWLGRARTDVAAAFSMSAAQGIRLPMVASTPASAVKATNPNDAQGFTWRPPV